VVRVVQLYHTGKDIDKLESTVSKHYLGIQGTEAVGTGSRLCLSISRVAGSAVSEGLLPHNSPAALGTDSIIAGAALRK
jgi:hypothetical protein